MSGATMTKTSSLCSLALLCVTACAGRSLDLDRGSGPSSSGAGPVAAEVIQFPDSVWALLADEARVYWTNRSGGGAQSCVFDRCDATKITYGSPAWPATLGEENIFFPGTHFNGHTDGDLLECPKTGCVGGPRVVFNDPTMPYGNFVVAANDGYLYWSSTLDIYRCPVTGCGEVPEVVAKGETGAFGMVVDRDEVFWGYASDVNENGEIHSAPSDGSRPPTVIAKGLGPSRSPLNFSVDATNVYWLDDSSHVQRCPRAGCDGQAPVTLVATDNAKEALRVDGSGLYWLETTELVGNWQHEQGGDVNHVSIRFCPLTGCAQGADAQILTEPKVGDFAMSSKFLYWNEPEVLGNGYHGDSKQIFRLAKPQ
jgi:hypothetical protein